VEKALDKYQNQDLSSSKLIEYFQIIQSELTFIIWSGIANTNFKMSRWDYIYLLTNFIKEIEDINLKPDS
jgi:hypothetical protein